MLCCALLYSALLCPAPLCSQRFRPLSVDEFYKHTTDERLLRGEAEVELYEPWEERESDRALAFLSEWSKTNREAEKTMKILLSGKPPATPTLEADRDSDAVLSDDLTTSLRLRWSSPEGSPEPICFIIEAGGRVTGRAVKGYTEITKDPERQPPAGEKPSFAMQRLMTGLMPNTKYAFRVTSMNNYGVSQPQYSVFCTLPPRPPAPFCVSAQVSPSKVGAANT